MRYNLIQDRSADHGIMPRWFYWNEAFAARLGPGRWLLLAPMALAFWRHWRMIIAWVVPFAALTLFRHKEERFLLSIWPFVLVGGLSGMLALADALRHVGRLRTRSWFGPLRTGAVAGLLAAVCVWAFVGTRKLPMSWLGGYFAAQSWVGRQPDATGLLTDTRRHLNGGHMVLGRNIPFLQYNATLVTHPIYNYVAVHEPKLIESMERRPEFQEVGEFDDVVLFRRTDGLVQIGTADGVAGERPPVRRDGTDSRGTFQSPSTSDRRAAYAGTCGARRGNPGALADPLALTRIVRGSSLATGTLPDGEPGADAAMRGRREITRSTGTLRATTVREEAGGCGEGRTSGSRGFRARRPGRRRSPPA